jgi:hypothetical protein
MRLQSTWSTAVGRISRPALAALTRRAEGKQQAKLVLAYSAARRRAQHTTQSSTAQQAPQHCSTAHCAGHRQQSWRAFASCGASSLEACTPALGPPPRPTSAPPKLPLSQLSPASALFPCSYSPVLSIYSSFCHPAPAPQPSPCLINH